MRVFVDEGAPMAALLAQGLGVRGWGLGTGADGGAVRAYAEMLSRLYPAADGDPTSAAVPRPPIASSQPLPTNPLLERLTERELEVLRLLAQGRSNQAIAQALVVAVGTVKRHVNSIMGKLEVASRLEAVARP